MRFKVFFSIVLSSFLSLYSESPPSKGDWESRIWKSYTVVDFESGEYGKKDWRFRGPKDQKLPDIFVSRNITAPLPGSRKALLFRFYEESNIAGQFVFPESIEFENHLKELIIPVYSSKSGGSLSLILQSHDYENTKIFLTHLNFRGWRNIHLKIRESMNQNDPVLNSKLVVRLIGLVYEPSQETSYGTEILVGIDDITAITRSKYKTLPDPASLLE